MVFVLTALINMRGVLAAMKKKSNLATLVLLVVILCSTSVTHSQVSLTPLTAAEIKRFMFDRLFTGEYPNGLLWSERFNRDLTSTYSESGQILEGIMRLDGDLICFSYPDSIDSFGGCFQVWKRGNNCFDFYSSQSLAGVFDRRFGRAWQARAWNADEPSTCFSDKIG